MTPWVTRLIIANAVLFLLTGGGQYQNPVYRMLALVPAWVLYRPWTLVTYMFLHAGFMHLLFNMIGLFFFGPRLEARLGGKTFLLVYLLSGLGGALLSFALSPGAAVVGASGAVFGILLGFARYWPHERIYIYGILPIRAQVMVLLLAGWSIYSGFTGAGAGVAHFAHLGGLLAGWGFLAWHDRRRSDWQKRAQPKRSGRVSRDEIARWDSIRLDDLHEVNRQEAERIRTKIADHGIGSLTPGEREFMDRMAGP